MIKGLWGSVTCNYRKCFPFTSWHLYTRLRSVHHLQRALTTKSTWRVAGWAQLIRTRAPEKHLQWHSDFAMQGKITYYTVYELLNFLFRYWTWVRDLLLDHPEVHTSHAPYQLLAGDLCLGLGNTTLVPRPSVSGWNIFNSADSWPLPGSYRVETEDGH